MALLFTVKMLVMSLKKLRRNSSSPVECSVGGSTDEAVVIYEVKRLVLLKPLYEGFGRCGACDFTNKKHLRSCLALKEQWRYHSLLRI